MSIDVLEPARPRVAPVNAKLLFLEPSGRRPRLNFTYDAPAAEVSEIYAPRTVFIRNARGCGASLDVEGFALRQHKSAVRDFRDDAEAGSLGRDEAATLVAQATGAARVHVFDHTVRRSAADAARQPSTRVHNDYTPLSAHRRVGELLGDEAKTLLQRRFAFINVWRPIQRPALNWPLASRVGRSYTSAAAAMTRSFPRGWTIATTCIRLCTARRTPSRRILPAPGRSKNWPGRRMSAPGT